MKNFLTIVMIALSLYSYSQDKLITGYIINKEDDTIHGNILYHNWNNNPVRITFEKDGKEIIYDHQDIKGFSVAGENYYSAVFKVETSPENLSQLSENSAMSFRPDSGFVLALIEGIKGLFYFKDKYGKESYYIKTAKGFELLQHKKYYKFRENQTTVVENNYYSGQLAMYLIDCPTIQEGLKNISYDKTSLTGLFNYYYKCTGSSKSYEKKKEKAIVKFGVVAGVTITSLTLKADEAVFIPEFSHSVNLSLGGSLDVIFPRLYRRWSLYDEFQFSSYSVNSEYTYTEDSKKYSDKVDIDFSYINWIMMIRYRFPVGKTWLFINGGSSVGYAIEKKQTYKETMTYGSITHEYEGDFLTSVRNLEIGVVGGAGIFYKHFSLEGRYCYGDGFSEMLSVGTRTGRIYILAGYIF